MATQNLTGIIVMGSSLCWKLHRYTYLTYIPIFAHAESYQKRQFIATKIHMTNIPRIRRIQDLNFANLANRPTEPSRFNRIFIAEISVTPLLDAYDSSVAKSTSFFIPHVNPTGQAPFYLQATHHGALSLSLCLASFLLLFLLPSCFRC